MFNLLSRTVFVAFLASMSIFLADRSLLLVAVPGVIVFFSAPAALWGQAAGAFVTRFFVRTKSGAAVIAFTAGGFVIGAAFVPNPIAAFGLLLGAGFVMSSWEGILRSGTVRLGWDLAEDVMQVGQLAFVGLLGFPFVAAKAFLSPTAVLVCLGGLVIVAGALVLTPAVPKPVEEDEEQRASSISRGGFAMLAIYQCGGALAHGIADGKQALDPGFATAAGAGILVAALVALVWGKTITILLGHGLRWVTFVAPAVAVFVGWSVLFAASGGLMQFAGYSVLFAGAVGGVQASAGYAMLFAGSVGGVQASMRYLRTPAQKNLFLSFRWLLIGLGIELGVVALMKVVSIEWNVVGLGAAAFGVGIALVVAGVAHRVIR